MAQYLSVRKVYWQGGNSKMAGRYFALWVATALVGCATQQPPTRNEGKPPASLAQARLEKGLALLAEGQAHQANGEFNRALAHTPSDANLHFLNGLAYRQIGQEGGQSVSELAETGYRLALEFDPGHWLAAWHLGLLQLDQRQYVEARKSLAQAARLRPRNPDIQLALAGSAYLASDAPVALLAAERTLALRPNDPEALKIAALSSAALGEKTGAREFSDRLRETRPAEAEIVTDRIEAWKLAREQMGVPDQGSVPNPSSAPPPPSTSGSATPVASGAVTDQGPLALGWSDCTQQSTNSVSAVGGFGSDGIERLQALPSPCKGVPLPRMAVVDVTLIRTHEATGYSQGVNLLDGLKIVLNGSYSYNSKDSPSRSITRSIGLPSDGITYSLNIFNAEDTAADVIARPSLLALDRTPATFFSGSTVSVAMTGQYGGNLSDRNIGVSLSVTPTFIDDDRLLLSVKGARSFIEPDQFDGFEQAITATNNMVSTSVIMRFGETLILSGLREREYTKSKNGVPVLRDVPVLQYLFSNRTDRDYAQHVLIVLTPRKPSTLDETERAANAYLRSPAFQLDQDDIGAEAVSALRARRPNLEATLAKIQLSRYQREFRTGDLSSRRFAPSPSMERVLQDARQMIYY